MVIKVIPLRFSSQSLLSGAVEKMLLGIVQLSCVKYEGVGEGLDLSRGTTGPRDG